MHGFAIAVAVGIFAMSLLMRFALFSQYGLPTSYLLFGLPGAGIGLAVLLLRLGGFTSDRPTRGFVAPRQTQPPTAAQRQQIHL